MSDSKTAPVPTPPAGDDEAKNTGGTNAGFTPPATQEDLDKIISDRLARERAKYADYDEVKAKAKAHDEYVASQKTETERLAEALEAEKRRVAELTTESLRNRVAAEKGVPAALLSGETEEALVASAEALIAFRADQEKTPRGPHVPNEGRTPGNLDDPNAQALSVLGFG